jgi:hypothetical protein
MTKGTAAIILYAASYRSEDVPASPRTNVPATLPEDVWVPHLVILARAVTGIAKTAHCYVLIDTGETPPQKEKNQSALRSVPDCGVFVAQFADDPWALIAPHMQEWGEQVKRGNLGAAFKLIDGLPDWMNSQKSLLKLQLLGRMAPNQEIVKLLRAEIASKTDMDPKVRLKLARIAQRAGEENIASDLLEPAVSALTSQEDLELALDVAADLGDHASIDIVAARLDKLYPGSSHLFKHRLTQKLYSREYAEVLILLAKFPSIDLEVKFLHETLALALQSAEMPDYARALEAIEQTLPNLSNWAHIVCAHDAIARREFKTAVSLCPPGRGRQLASGTARMLLRTTRELLIARNPDGSLAVSGEQLRRPVLSLIDYLGAHPEDSRTRLSLVSVLSIETSGSLGLAVVIAVTLKLAGAIDPAHVNLRKHKTQQTDEDLDILPFLVLLR